MSGKTYSETQELLLSIYKSLPMDKLYVAMLKLPTILPKDGKAELEIIKSKNGKELYVIAAEHYSKDALDLLHYRIRSKVGENSRDWLFLIEGNSNLLVPETLYAYILAQKLDIPAENPIKDPFNKDVIYEATKQGLKKNDIYLCLMTGVLNTINDDKVVIDHLSRLWDVDKNYLYGLLLDLYVRTSGNSEALKHEKEKFRKIHYVLLKISNKLSLKTIKQLLEKYDDKKKILFYLGKAHKEILYEL